MEYKNLKTHAYEVIKEKIVNCEYLPNEFINENILIQEIGSSRTPVREALNRLEQESLLHIIPKKGIMISELSVNEINMIYEARNLVEPYMIKNHAHNIDTNLLEDIHHSFTNKSFSTMDDVYKADYTLHKLINSSSNNKYFSNMLEKINLQNHRIRILSAYSKDRLIDSQKEHIDIIEALLSKDFVLAEKNMRVHLENAKNTAFNFLLANGGWKKNVAASDNQ